MAPLGSLAEGREPAAGMPSQEITFDEVSFAYPGSRRAVLSGLDLTVPAGTSLAIVGQNGAGKTTLAKLLCRLYDPSTGAINVDGVDLRSLEPDGWRRRIAAVFQDFVRFELSLRENVDPGREASDDDIRAALVGAGAENLAELDTPLAKGYRKASTSRVVSGSGSPWHGRCARYDAAQVWYCSTSQQHSSMSEARQMCSTGCCRLPVTSPRS